MINNAENGLETGNEEKPKSIESELGEKLREGNATEKDVIEILSNRGRNTDNQKLHDVISKELEDLRKYMMRPIDDVRTSEYIGFTVEEILDWSS